MATEEVLRGPTGETVRENVARLRKKRGLSLRALAARTEDTNRPLGHGSINAVEQGKRRVDVDDLLVLATALNVTPLSLLFPYSDNQSDSKAGEEIVEVSGLGMVKMGVLWGWGKGLFRPPWMRRSDGEWEDADEDGVSVASDEPGSFVVPREVSGIMIGLRRIDEKRREKTFELMDLYVDEYRKARHRKQESNGDD